MGIFDDAIRQHLDLKRRQGADEEELQNLEDEAFGPPARPGDPDFPETGEADAEGESEDGMPAEPVTDTQTAPELEAEEVPSEPPAPGSAPPVVAEEPSAPVAEPSDEAAPHGDALLADPQAEPEPSPADEGPVEDTGAESFSTTEREAIADQPTEFFDQTPEPIEPAEEPVEDPAVDEEPAPVDEATPVDEMRVVEETEPVSEEMPAEPEEASAAEADQAEAEEEGAEEAEDVLEETPEFLRDNPDDDELWFEQGEPKDFDF